MNDCCDQLDSCYMEPLARLYQLRNRLELIKVRQTKFIAYFRCKLCGQLWEEHHDPFSRFELYSVFKSFPDENGNRRALYFDFHKGEITFLNTNETMKFERGKPDNPGCLLSWLM